MNRLYEETLHSISRGSIYAKHS